MACINHSAVSSRHICLAGQPISAMSLALQIASVTDIIPFALPHWIIIKSCKEVTGETNIIFQHDWSAIVAKSPASVSVCCFLRTPHKIVFSHIFTLLTPVAVLKSLSHLTTWRWGRFWTEEGEFRRLADIEMSHTATIKWVSKRLWAKMRASAWDCIARVFNQTRFLSHLFKHNCTTHAHDTHRTAAYTANSASPLPSHTHTHTHTPKSLSRIISHVLGGKPHQLSQQGPEQWNTSQTVVPGSNTHSWTCTHTHTHTHTHCGYIYSER